MAEQDFTSVVTVEKFSGLTGVPVETLRKKIAAGQVPLFRFNPNLDVREKVMVNMTVINKMAEQQGRADSVWGGLWS